jgi:DNA-binding TFAR19-related protein (PDSD5 family)
MNIDDIKKQLAEQDAEKAVLKEQLEMIEKIAKQKMTREAVSRYGTVKLAHPEKAIRAISYVAQAVQSGFKEMIDDEKFKEILKQIN